MRKWWVAGGVTAAATLVALLSWSLAPAQQPSPEVLRWGGDATGGGPYVYKDDDGKIVGFEVELADELARRLGMRPSSCRNRGTICRRICSTATSTSSSTATSGTRSASSRWLRPFPTVWPICSSSSAKIASPVRTPSKIGATCGARPTARRRRSSFWAIRVPSAMCNGNSAATWNSTLSARRERPARCRRSLTRPMTRPCRMSSPRSFTSTIRRSRTRCKSLGRKWSPAMRRFM